MLSASLIAFGHFLALLALIAALVVEMALLSQAMGIEAARRIRRADRAYGLAAILLLVFGFLRVIYFEKGSDYYFSNDFFLLKLGLFVGLGLLSIYPTLLFAGWGKDINQGIAPEVSEALLKRLKKIIHYELLLVAGIMLCASLMAKGLGS